MAVPLRVLDELADKRLPKTFRFGPLAERQLHKLSQRLQKSETQIIELAIGHLWGTLIRKQGVWMDDPTEPMRAMDPGSDGPEEAQDGPEDREA